MKPYRLAVLGLASVLMLVACGNNDDATTPAGDDDLVGRTFLSTDVTFDDDGDIQGLVSDTRLSLTFTENGISANAGCNTMGGKGSVDDGTLVIDGGLAMTEMGCDADRMAQDQWYADLLTSGPSLTLDGDQLTLSSQGTVVTMTDQEVVEPDAELTGTTWTLDSLIQGDAASTVPKGVTSTVTFTAQGSVQVSPGCNSGGGPYTVEGDQVTFGPIALTQMACEGPASDVEAAVIQVMDGTATFQLDGSSLTLTNGPSGLVYRASDS
jgi:heat shock protein HslJ